MAALYLAESVPRAHLDDYYLLRHRICLTRATFSGRTGRIATPADWRCFSCGNGLPHERSNHSHYLCLRGTIGNRCLKRCGMSQNITFCYFLQIFGFISAFLERGQTLHTYLSGLFVGWCLSNAFVVFYLTGSENSAPAVKLVSIFTVSYGLVYTLANVTRYLWSRAKLNVRKQAELRLKYLDEEKSIARTRKNTKDCDPVSAPEVCLKIQ